MDDLEHHNNNRASLLKMFITKDADLPYYNRRLFSYFYAYSPSIGHTALVLCPHVPFFSVRKPESD